MRRVTCEEYAQYIDIANSNQCGRVYPLSVAEGIQSGDIFVSSADASEVLFWTHCGFAYLSETVNDIFLKEIYEYMTDENMPRRFLLMTDSEKVESYFRTKENVVLERRSLFEYRENAVNAKMDVPKEFELKELDAGFLSKVSGNIVPSLFWKSADDFLLKGKGYCVVNNEEVASWAFSAAVSSQEIDIGIETNLKYQKQGLGMIVAKRMMQYAIEQGKKPVWACHYQNTASAKMAEKLGFVKTGECTIIKRKM